MSSRENMWENSTLKLGISIGVPREIILFLAFSILDPISSLICILLSDLLLPKMKQICFGPLVDVGTIEICSPRLKALALFSRSCAGAYLISLLSSSTSRFSSVLICQVICALSSVFIDINEYLSKTL